MRALIAMAAAVSLVVIAPGLVAGADKSVAEEILDILRANGQLSERQYDELLMKAQDEIRAPARASVDADADRWYDRIEMYGDVRARYEGFWFNEDPTGFEKDDRQRMRYRARIGLRAEVNDHFDFNLRIATGDDANSRNQTLGSSRKNSTGTADGLAGDHSHSLSNSDEWAPDSLNIDWAYLTYHPFAGSEIPLGGKKLDLMFGKMPNPFRSKQGKDMIVWDGDFTPEGVALKYVTAPTESLMLTLNGAFFYVEENSTSSDPHLSAFQLVSDFDTGRQVKLGGMASFYAWRSMGDSDVVNPGLTDDASMDIVDFRGWVAFPATDSWPVKLYGSYTKNLDAEATLIASEQDQAWSAGLELGTKKKIVQLGVGYFRVGLNSVPATFTDSDLFDGATNRKGWIFYGARQIFPQTDLKATLFKSNALDRGATGTVDNSNRYRLQTDIVVKF